jgi:Tfp pilus assembly protein PilW
MNEPSKPQKSENQRGMSVIELLFTLASIGATVVVAALGTSKRPITAGD